MTEIEPIALFDMDGTLCDYDRGLIKSLEQIHSPYEPSLKNINLRNLPSYLSKRRDMILESSSWWENLEKFQLGWDLLNVAKSLDYKLMILTQGPKRYPNSWAGKKLWVNKYLGPEIDMTITRDKGLVYGKVLIDDYPEYLERWLSWRERGLAIMPANESNKNFKHPQVIRYDGTNLKKVERAMKIARDRKRGEELKL